MMTADLGEFAIRIVEMQLAWLRSAGPVSAGVGLLFIAAVGIAVARLAWAARRPQARRPPSAGISPPGGYSL